MLAYHLYSLPECNFCLLSAFKAILYILQSNNIYWLKEWKINTHTHMVKTTEWERSFGICGLILSVLNLFYMYYYGTARVVLARFYFSSFSLCLIHNEGHGSISTLLFDGILSGSFWLLSSSVLPSIMASFIIMYCDNVIRCKCDKHADVTRTLDTWQEALVI